MIMINDLGLYPCKCIHITRPKLVFMSFQYEVIKELQNRRSFSVSTNDSD